MSIPEYNKLVKFTKGLVWDMPEVLPQDMLHDILMMVMDSEQTTRRILRTDDIKGRIASYVREYRMNLRGKTFYTDDVLKRHRRIADEETSRYCKGCGEIKPISGFSLVTRYKAEKKELFHQCKECQAKVMREYYSKKENFYTPAQAEASKRYVERVKDSEEFKARNRERQRRFRAKNIEKSREQKKKYYEKVKDSKKAL